MSAALGVGERGADEDVTHVEQPDDTPQPPTPYGEQALTHGAQVVTHGFE
jgi:hypothetical protein